MLPTKKIKGVSVIKSISHSSRAQKFVPFDTLGFVHWLKRIAYPHKETIIGIREIVRLTGCHPRKLKRLKESAIKHNLIEFVLDRNTPRYKIMI